MLSQATVDDLEIVISVDKQLLAKVRVRIRVRVKVRVSGLLLNID